MKQRLIDANALPEMEIERFDTTDAFEVKAKGAGRNHMRKIIEEAPTVDAVQVVRCSKCVHFVEWTAYEKTHCLFQHDGMCKYWNCISTNKNSFCDHGIRITDGYCADGERRSDGEQ